MIKFLLVYCSLKQNKKGLWFKKLCQHTPSLISSYKRKLVSPVKFTKEPIFVIESNKSEYQSKAPTLLVLFSRQWKISLLSLLPKKAQPAIQGDAVGKDCSDCIIEISQADCSASRSGKRDSYQSGTCSISSPGCKVACRIITGCKQL